MREAIDGSGASVRPSWLDRTVWKMPGAGGNETSIAAFGTRFPVRPLFGIVAGDLANHGVALDGTFGRRSVSRCSGGQVTGDRLSGRVAEDVSNEWRLSDAQGERFAVEGLVTLLADSGETILMKYRGRGGGRYGSDGARVGAVFEAPASLAWLNSVCAAGTVAVVGTALHFDLFELLGQADDEGAFLAVEPLYHMIGRDTVGDRLTIHGAVSNRYFTMAEQGCLAEGELTGEWIKGMSWGPHRMAFTTTSLPWQIDMRVMMETNTGPVLQQYLGTIPDRAALDLPDDDRSWRTAAVFEADARGGLAWLNEIVAVGVGWKEDNEARYHYYTLA